jgi:hypothetical protein
MKGNRLKKAYKKNNEAAQKYDSWKKADLRKEIKRIVAAQIKVHDLPL